MKNYKIHSAQTQKILFEARAHCFKSCLEQAVIDRIPLPNASLRHANLANANLDDAMLEAADFTGTNLTGANLSESRLKGANYMNTVLYNTCLAYSDLTHGRFENASFGGTDISGSDLSYSRFSTLSCFSLDFRVVSAMKNCVFVNGDGMLSRMSRPPIVIKGLASGLLVFFDNHIKSGDALLHDHSLFENLRTCLMQV